MQTAAQKAAAKPFYLSADIILRPNSSCQAAIMRRQPSMLQNSKEQALTEDRLLELTIAVSSAQDFLPTTVHSITHSPWHCNKNRQLI